ncbi:MAG TPA: hypothetical protein VNN10_05255 [Dehalococcoidia bacterium]|nr:hypothetical protein [Dehalococcoidia bacterium]
MDTLDSLRQELLSFALVPEEFETRLAEFEDAVRAHERESTLEAIRHSLNTIRGLVAFLRQEVLACVGPLERLAEDLERQAAAGAPPAHPSAQTHEPVPGPDTRTSA